MAIGVDDAVEVATPDDESGARSTHILNGEDEDACGCGADVLIDAEWDGSQGEGRKGQVSTSTRAVPEHGLGSGGKSEGGESSEELHGDLEENLDWSRVRNKKSRV